MRKVKKISAKRLRDMLEQVVVHNDHGLFKHVRPVPPVLSYTKQDRHWSACWRVWRAGLVVDPEAHWHDNHAKTFLVSSAQEKAEQFAAAKDWASERYGYTTDEWVKTPYGSWVPRTGLEAALRHYLPHLFAEEGEDTTSIEPSGVRETTIHIPGDPVVKMITDKLYGVEDGAEDGALHWYEVRGANVAVFVQALDEHDARSRVRRMINRMTMDCSLELHITKRDPRVVSITSHSACPAGDSCAGAAFPGHPAHSITRDES